MPKFKTTYQKGINQDSSNENYPQGSYFNLENGRLISDETTSNFKISSFKGNSEVLNDELTGELFPSYSDISSDYQSISSVELEEDILNGDITEAEINSKISSLSTWSTIAICGSTTIQDDLILFTRFLLGGADTNQLGVWRLNSNYESHPNGYNVEVNNIKYRLELIYILENTEYTTTDQIKIDAVGYYESDRIQNIYWLDGFSSLKKLNITEPGVFIKDSALVDVIPETKITPPEFIDMNSNGSIPVGQRQYAYSYYIPNGQKTFYSLPSPLIHLTTSDEKASDSGRYYSGIDTYNTDVENNGTISNVEVEDSTKSITININDVDTRYEYIEIIAIHYPTLASNPTIESVYQGKINGDEFQFTDYGTTVLDTYTIDEYRLFNIDFVPQTLAIKDNILFVGNITEKFYNSDAWEDFDSRAFRFDYDASGNCESKVYDSFSEITGSSDNGITITSSGGSVDWDNVTIKDDSGTTTGESISDYQDSNTINRFNNIDLTPNQTIIPYGVNPPTYQYAFQKDGVTVGGSGPNLAYRFVAKGLDLNQKLYDTSGPDTLGDGYVIDSATNRDELNIGPDSYASPYNSAYYKQYKRNEIYRFALVVFSKKGTPSEPKWIADIRTPVFGKNGINVPASTSTNRFDIVEYSEISGGSTNTVTSIANALGIDFSLQLSTELKDDISGYAVVRCDRDSTRTNLGQGLVNQVRYFNTPGLSSPVDEGNDPKTFDELSSNMNLHWAITGVTSRSGGGGLPWGYDDYSHYEWISPDATFNNNLTPYNSAYLHSVGSVESNSTGSNMDAGLYSIWNDQTVAPATKWGVYDNGCLANYIYSSGAWLSDRTDRQYRSFIHTFSHYASTDNTTGTVQGIYSSTAPISDGALMSPGQTKLLSTGETLGWSCSHAGGVRSYNGQSMYFKVPDIVSGTSPIVNIASTAADTFGHFVLSDYIRFSDPYGGSTYNARELNTYDFADNYITISDHVDRLYMSGYTVDREDNSGSNKVGKTVFGGDTFIGYYQHIKSTVPADNASAVNDLYTSLITFPCESTINLNLRHDSYLPTKTDEFNINLYAEPRPGLGSSCFTDSIIQLEDMNLYNSVFSKSGSSYIIQSLANNENLGRKFITKVMASKKKYLGEYVDSWTQFGANEFIDLDTTAGEVTKLLNHKDGLYAFQSKGISRLAVNEKSTVQDDQGQSIVLGTGGVLQYPTYITKNNGTKHKWSVVSTPETIYYYDTYENKISYLGNNNNGISDIKGLFSYMSDVEVEDINSVDAIYNHKYREAHFSFDFSNSISAIDNRTFSMILNDKIKSFTSINKYGDGDARDIPFMYHPFNKNILTSYRVGSNRANDNLFYEDIGDYNVLYNGYNPLQLTLLLNPFKENVTVLDSIEFKSIVSDPDIDNRFDKIINDETITSIRVYTETQDTGTIDLVSTTDRGRSIIRKLVRTWRYNYLRNSIGNKTDRLRDYYFYIDITFDSTAHTGAITNTPRYFELGNVLSSFKDIRTTYL